MTDRPAPFFVGDHPALDFLNTVATPVDVPVEWLQDGRDLVDWLERASMIGAEAASRFRASTDRRTLNDVAARARALREWLRGFVTRHKGQSIPPGAVKSLGPLNAVLAGDTSYLVIEAGEAGAPRMRRAYRWESPEDLLLPLAGAAADLICGADFRMIRACEGHVCTLLFLDRTKSHARRWCSMAVCGNRAKAAAHRARKRDDGS
ncbi:ABATE domain-containing protein [bacterium]|nr:ABATE domain-containing protein [bacterium]